MREYKVRSGSFILGKVTAKTQRSAINKAKKQFKINSIWVTQIN